MSGSDFRQIPFGRPWITDEDRKAVLAVLEGHILTHGPQAKAFLALAERVIAKLDAGDDRTAPRIVME